MNDGCRDEIRAFNQTMIDAYWGDENTPAESVPSIARRCGRDPSTINKLIQMDKAANGDRCRSRLPRDPRSSSDKKPFSPRHGRIGVMIARHRMKLEMGPSSYGLELQWSRVRVRNMEMGAHDFTIGEIVQLAAFMKVPFEELIAGGLVAA